MELLQRRCLSVYRGLLSCKSQHLIYQSACHHRIYRSFTTIISATDKDTVTAIVTANDHIDAITLSLSSSSRSASILHRLLQSAARSSENPHILSSSSLSLLSLSSSLSSSSSSSSLSLSSFSDDIIHMDEFIRQHQKHKTVVKFNTLLEECKEITTERDIEKLLRHVKPILRLYQKYKKKQYHTVEVINTLTDTDTDTDTDTVTSIDDSIEDNEEVIVESPIAIRISDPDPSLSSSSWSSSSALSRTRRGRLRYDPSLAYLSNLCAPHLLYPLARSLNRRIIVHMGPTNSGKTHSAMQALSNASSGIYCAPLRLLAWENYDRLNKQGLAVNLITGQELIETNNATHISSTVEMVNIDRIVDVGIIDEMQMIATDDRGGSWTRAFLGLPAKELHICGDISITQLVQHLCSVTGEKMSIQRYKRLTPLRLCPAINHFHSLERGDAIIAFSRSQLYSLKYQIETQTNHRCCLIYGSLPPDVRREQAQLFNAADSQYSIMIATDAIGMGLNLAIRRIVFCTLEKFDGNMMRTLTNREALQIAGRAGRYASQYNIGYATTLYREDYQILKSLLNTPLTPLRQAGLTPSFTHIQQLHRSKPTESLSAILSYLALYAEIDDSYFLCQLDDMKDIADLIHTLTSSSSSLSSSLSLEDKFTLCCAPVDLDKPAQREAMVKFVTQFDSPNPIITFDTLAVFHSRSYHEIDDYDRLDLSTLEDVYAQLDLYIWLCRRFGEHIFIHREEAERHRDAVSSTIANGLQASASRRKWVKPARHRQAQYQQRPRLRR